MSWLTRTEVPALPSRETWRQEVARRADGERLWTGMSGDTLTGREIAELLLRTQERLGQTGWEPTTTGGLREAMVRVAPGGSRDMAPRVVALALMGLIVQVLVQSPSRVDIEAWEARPGRTWAEVKEILTKAGAFAREHGPQAGGR